MAGKCLLTKKGCDFMDDNTWDGYEKLDITEMSSCKMFYHIKVASPAIKCQEDSVNCD